MANPNPHKEHLIPAGKGNQRAAKGSAKRTISLAKVLVNPEEKAIIARGAELAGKPVAQWLRELAINESNRLNNH